jgi:hypothetical protein
MEHKEVSEKHCWVLQTEMMHSAFFPGDNIAHEFAIVTFI